MAQKITVAELLVDLGIGKNDAAKAAEKLDTRLGKAKKSAKLLGTGLKQLAKGFAVFATAATGAALGVFKFVDSVATTGDEIIKTSKKIGTGVEELQRLRFAADRSGADVKKMDLAIKNLSKGMEDAASGGGLLFRQSIESLGLELLDLQGLTAEEKIGLIGDALGEVSDKGQRTAIAMNLFGSRAGPELVPLLLEGSKGIMALGDEAERLGLVMGEDAAKQSEVFVDRMTDLKAVLTGVKNTIGVTLIPVVQDLVKRFTDWLLVNKDLLALRVEEFFLKVINVAKLLLPVFEALGKAFVFVVENLDLLIGLLAGVKLASAFSAAATGFTAMGFAASAALGPIGLILGALTALIPIALRAGNALGDFLARDESILRATKRQKAPTATGVASPLARQIASESGTIRQADRRIIQLQNQGASENEIQFEINRRNAAAKRKAGLEKRQANELRKAQETEAAEADLPTPALGPELPPGFVEPGTEAARKRGGARRAEKEKKRPLSITSVSDLLTAAAGGDIEGLAERTPSVEGVEPTVAISITNNNIELGGVNQTFEGQVDAAQLANAARAAQRFFKEQLAIAGQQLAPNKVV
jgi:hypothetical protein